MSMITWINYGYGICTDSLESVELSKIKELIHLAPKYEAHIKEVFKSNDITEPTAEDYLEAAEYYGVASILAEVIDEVEGIRLDACDNEDGERYLLFSACYPWQLTDAERNFTEESLRDLFLKYAAVLSDDPPVAAYQSVENWG